MVASPLPTFPLDIATGPGIEASRDAGRLRLDLNTQAIRTTGTGNTYRVDTDGRIKELRGGIGLLIQADRTNTGPTEIIVDGFSVRPLTDPGGAPQIADRIVAERFYQILFDDAAQVWRVQGGASTLDEIPGFIDAHQEALDAADTATGKASIATAKAAEVETARSQVATNTADVATKATQVAADRAATQNARADALTASTQAQNAVATGRITRDALPASGEWQNYADGAQLEVLIGANAGLYVKTGAVGSGVLTKKSDATVSGNERRITGLRKTFIIPGYAGRVSLSSTNGRVIAASGNDVADLKARPLPTASRRLLLPDRAPGLFALSSTNGKAVSGPLRSGGLGMVQMAREAAATALAGGLRTFRIFKGAKGVVILITIGGQSLSLRGGSIVPGVYTFAPPSTSVVMPSVGFTPLGQIWTGMVPAYEAIKGSAGETGFTRLGNGIRDALSGALGIDVTVALVVTGAGGTPIASLSAGTAVGEETGLNIQRVTDWCRSQNRECWHLMDLWIHGNDDTGSLSRENYETRLYKRHEWLAHLSATLTQRPPSLPFKTYVTQFDYGHPSFCTMGGPSAAQLAACMGMNSPIRWAGTSYPFDHVDGTHMDSRNYYWYAEQNLGLILRDYFGEGIRPFAVHRAYWLSDTKVRLEYYVPVPPFVLDETNLICQSVGIAGLKGLQYDNGSGASSPQPTAVTVIDDGSGAAVSGVAGSGEYGKAIIDVDWSVTARTGPYRRLGIGLGQGSGGGLGYLATGRLTTSGGVPQSFTIDTGGNSWTNGTNARACIVSGNAGTFVTDATASGGAITGAVLPAATGMNDNPYVAFLRAGAGRSTGPRTLFRDAMNLASGLGWDGVLGSVNHPRTIHNWAAHQLVDL